MSTHSTTSPAPAATRAYRIMHEAPAAPGISVMEVAQIDAPSAEAALLLWHPAASKVSNHDGRPCLCFGFAGTVLRRYTAEEL